MASNSAVNKLIKFYIVQVEPSLNFTSNTSNNIDTNLFTLFKLGFKNGKDYYSYEFNKNHLFFDIKELNENLMFGICSVIENIKATAMIQSRDINTNQTNPFTNLGNNKQLEAYTFFYIDFKNCRMAAISNKKIAKIHEAITSFIWSNSNGNFTPHISIYPEKITDIEKALGSLKKFNWLEMEFAQPQNLNNIKCMSESLKNDFTFDKYQVKFKLKSTEPTFPINLNIFRKNNDVNTDKLSKLSVIGKNELGIDETINLIEAIYTKTISLELTDDTVKNLDYIKKKLKYYLDLHMSQD